MDFGDPEAGDSEEFDRLYNDQKQVQEMFAKALPFTLKVYELDPNNETALTMLSGIAAAFSVAFGGRNIAKSPAPREFEGRRPNKKAHQPK